MTAVVGIVYFLTVNGISFLSLPFPEERRLREEEKPLFVQLNWGSDVREGRFLLRNEDDPTVRVSVIYLTFFSDKKKILSFYIYLHGLFLCHRFP